jgi:hypothetical protein
MLHGRIEGATNVLGAKQGYKPLYVRATNVTDPVSTNATYLLETAWTPTPEELDMLNRGASVHVGLLCSQHPPIKVGVGPIPDESVLT